MLDDSVYTLSRLTGGLFTVAAMRRHLIMNKFPLSKTNLIAKVGVGVRLSSLGFSYFGCTLDSALPCALSMHESDTYVSKAPPAL